MGITNKQSEITEEYLERFVEYWWHRKWQEANHGQRKKMIMANAMTVEELIGGLSYLERSSKKENYDNTN